LVVRPILIRSGITGFVRMYTISVIGSLYSTPRMREDPPSKLGDKI
jgi:hypothetical protein